VPMQCPLSLHAWEQIATLHGDPGGECAGNVASDEILFLGLFWCD